MGTYRLQGLTEQSFIMVMERERGLQPLQRAAPLRVLKYGTLVETARKQVSKKCTTFDHRGHPPPASPRLV